MTIVRAESKTRATVQVKTNLSTFTCAVGPCDCCSYCSDFIVWGFDRKGVPVALEPWGDSEDEKEIHFANCRYRELPEELERWREAA